MPCHVIDCMVTKELFPCTYSSGIYIRHPYRVCNMEGQKNAWSSYDFYLLLLCSLTGL